MEKEHYDLMSSIVVTLMNADELNTYDFLAAELGISKSTISAMKQGQDLRLYYNVLAIQYMMKQIWLTSSVVELEKQIRKALVENRDLVVGTIPHQTYGANAPEDWKVVLEWG